MTHVIFVVLAALLGGFFYRARGGGWHLPDVPRPVWQIICALPYAAIVYMASQAMPAIFSAVALGFTAAILCTGHASYMDLGHADDGSVSGPADGQKDEWYGGWIPGGGYWHDFAGLAVKGLMIVLPAVPFIRDGPGGAMLLLSGLLMPCAYAAGWALRRFGVSDPVAVGEVLAGALLWGIAGYVLLGVAS